MRRVGIFAVLVYVQVIVRSDADVVNAGVEMVRLVPVPVTGTGVALPSTQLNEVE